MVGGGMCRIEQHRELQFLLRLLLLLQLLCSVHSFVNSPKIISKDGNLIFESGANRNISFRLSGNSRLVINEEYDVLDLLMPIGGTKKRTTNGTAKDELSGPETFVDLRELADQLAAFKAQAFGANGVNTVLRQLQNRTRSSRLLLRRLEARLRVAETKLHRLKMKLELNSCQSNPCENGGTCFNTYNGYRCQCIAAFEGSRCERDVNECALLEGTDLGCQNGGQCVNQFGSFSCLCAAGWHGLHCSQRKADCSAASNWELCGHGSCVSSNDPLGYRCICEAGWRSNGLTPLCTEDVDECTATPTPTHPLCSTKCINLPGSFACSPCPAGLTGNGFNCRDINECETNNGGCSLSPRVECINTYGSSHCADCPVGWSGDGHTCQRDSSPASGSDGSGGSDSGVASCSQRGSLCHPAAICSVISNTIVCSCPAGMLGTGYGENGCVRGTNNNCNDMPCLNGGVCLDAGPSNYTCLCPRGFHAPRCEPLPNPCTSQPCKNDGRCSPTPGGDGFVCQCQPGYRGRLCDSRFSSCNGLLTGLTGRLRYPPRGDSYEHNAQCAWVIRTNESLVLNVTFVSFSLEDSTECRFDWLQLNDGRSAAAQIIGRYCGNHLPHGGNIISSSHQLYLWFRSDNSTASRGFDLTWESIAPQCGGLVQFETHGTLASPGSPGNYPRNRDCQWHLVAPSDKRIKLTFFSLQLEQHDSCSFDFVSITDAISGRELYKYCSRERPPPLLLPTHEALVRFHSDETGSDLGFQLHYSAEERLPGCGGVYTSKQGSIVSPVYALGSDAVSCDYEIRLALGESIRVEFDTFQLAADSCLEFYDVAEQPNGQTAAVLQSKECGELASLPPSIHSLYHRLRIKYYTSGVPSVLDHFKLDYRMDCSGTYDANEGIISSPGYPNLTSSEHSCTYKILTPPDTVVMLKRLDFQLYSGSYAEQEESAEDNEANEASEAPTCVAGDTSLIINDGLNQAILGPYCDLKLPEEQYVSRTNMLVLHLQSQTRSRGRGFRFQYRAVPVNSDQCGGVHTKEGQNIRLPLDQNGQYRNDMSCYWIIMAPPGKAIVLHWLSFNMESMTDCSYDYVDIIEGLSGDGGDSTANVLGRYCGITLPKDMTTQARILTVRFESDLSGTGEGFELSYRFVPRDSCGGHIHSGTGLISSPNFPANYSQGLDCVWQLTAPEGTQLELQAEIFELANNSTGCPGDWLAVYNGRLNSSHLIGRYCGTRMPRRIPSFTHELTLHFHSDDVESARGFRLSWHIFASGCGGRLNGRAGTITSPNYPAMYPHNAHCEWHLRTHPGSSLQVTIEDLELESNECNYDYLRIYMGDSANQLPELYSQSICTMPESPVFVYHTNEATIVFHSDVNNEERGFRLSYVELCHNVLNGSQGVIESINYGEAFFEGAINCSWQLRPPRGNRIRLEFSHLDYRANRLPTDADGGVYLLDGANVVPVVGLLEYNAKGDELIVLHNSSRVNFRLEYRVDGCLWELRSDTGSIHSLNYPKMYPNNLECYWLIHAAPGQIIELTVLHMDIEESVNCTKDALVISDSDRDVDVHERHCGQAAQLVVTSAGHKLHVRFISDSAHNGLGFEANYRVIKSPCGGKLSTKHGLIQSPGYPRPYPKNSKCEWLVEVSPHHTIIFDMVDLNVEPTFNCGWDYVAAYDMASNNNIGESDADSDALDDTEGRQLFKWCSKELEGLSTPIESATNRALVRFVTDDSVQYRGFQLRYRESCGQKLSIDETDFQYLVIAHQVARNETCVWVLQAADPGKHIIFTPTHIDLHREPAAQYPKEGDCMPHGVQIYEGITASGQPRLQFCRSHPPAIISRGNALTLSVPMSLVAEFEAHYMTMDTACGSIYNSLSGRFSSPYYPDSYPVNIECQWLLLASEGNSLALTVESLDMEQSEGCNNDYLELREQSERGALIGVFCGNQLPPAVRSKGSIWIKFKSNDDVVGEGFMASYNYERHNELNGTQGKVESPHYPDKFESDEPYTWRITVDNDYVVLVNLEHLRDVDSPHVSFYDGYTLIGDRLEVQPDQPIITHTNILFVTARRGPFQFSWSRLSKEALASNRTAELQARQCGQQMIALNRSLITFNSPGYPLGYAPNLNCSWILVATEPATHALVQLVTVDFEQFSESCYADYLIISSSNDLQHWTELAKICRQPNDTQAKMFHGKPYLRLDFITDGSVNHTGFSSLLRTVCGSELSAAQGVVNVSAIMANNYLSPSECVWTIRVRQGKRIKIRFLESQLNNRINGDGSACSNYVVVRNGFAEDSPFLGRGKYCENNITDELVTSSNRAYIKLQRAFIPRVRVVFHYEEIMHGCGGRFTLEEGPGNYSERLISSPNYPNLPHPHSVCVWQISAPAHHRIAVHFVGNFDLMASSGSGSGTGDDGDGDGCDREYVQLNDGSTELMPQLGRFCGSVKPDTVYSSGSQLRVKFYTDVLEPHTGFQALIQLAVCGGSYYSASGTIHSPRPEQLQLHLQPKRLKECVFTIEVEKGSTIDLRFDPLQLPREQTLSGNCTANTHLLLEEMEPFGPDNQERISDSLHICGTRSRHLLVETNKVVVRLRLPSGKLASEESFVLRYSAIGARCGETIVASQGVLQTPNYPAGVRVPTHCVWRVLVPKGRRVKVEVLDFDNGASSNSTHSSFRGRIIFANDHKMQSVIGRYANNPPAVIYSTDNTMGIDAFLLPFSQHRGFKLRFSAYGQSECRSRLLLDESGTLLFTRPEESSLVYCSYDLQPPPNSTLLLQIRRHNSTFVFKNNRLICRVMSPLRLIRTDVSEPLLPLLLCGDHAENTANLSVRLPFPVAMIVSGNRRNRLNLLELTYSLQYCGGVSPLEPGDNLTITQPSQLADGGARDCAWAVGPDQTVEDPLSPQDVQLEVSVSVNLDGDCQLHYLLLYNGPDQNSPLVERYCNQVKAVNLVVERGLFLEYHREPLPNANHSSSFNVTVKYGSGCGGRLTYPYRLIEFSEQYKNNVECVWEIEAAPGFHIELSFEGRFYIEDSASCAKDYLLVQQRNSNGSIDLASADAVGEWTDLQTLCGRNPPSYINSTSSSMRLIFRSDGDVTGDGFTARFERNCGGLLYAVPEPRQLISPGYPTGYAGNIVCNYTFMPLDPHALGVLVRFLEFDLERSPTSTCLFDNVTVSMRDTSHRQQPDAMLCGVKLQHAYRAQRSISIILRTDSSYSGRGFKLEYSTSLCGGIVNSSQLVESPRQHQDDLMPHNSDCYWNLTAPEGHKFTVKFELLDFEAGNTLCSYDGVEIFASPVPDEKQRMARFCGRMTENLPTLHIPNNRALIHSYSDDRDPSRGFRALVRLLANCDEHIVLGKDNASYVFNKFVGSYANNLDCSLTFRADAGYQISVEFRSFHVAATPGCTGDYLELRDGAGPFADEIGRFCGQDLPPKLSASRHVLFMRFVTDATDTDTGFELLVKANPRLCGNPLIKLDSKQSLDIRSPVNERGTYDNNMFCLWKIESESWLHLKFVSLDMEAPNATGGCDTDYLRIYTNEDAQLLEQGYGNEVIFNGNRGARNYYEYALEHVYCGNGLPDDYYPNSKQVYLKFRTNQAIAKTGFHIVVVPDSGCRHSYGGLQGRIKISENLDCDAEILAPANHTLSLYYAEVIFSSSDCDVEHVEIFDKRTNTSLQRLCSYLDPGKSLFTFTNELRLRIKTGSYFNSFDITYLATPVAYGPGCGGQLYNTEGIFSNPFYPLNVRNNSDCLWSIRVPSNTRVMLNFLFFDLGSMTTCHTDYLLILEENERAERSEVRRFCGEDKPRVYISQRSQLFVRFHKSVNYDGIGWVIKFSGVHSNYEVPPYLLE